MALQMEPSMQNLPTAPPPSATNNSLPQPTRRPLRREGAFYFPSAAERAMEAAMMRSSSPPVEPALGKRTRDEGGAEDNDSTGPGDGKPLPSAANAPQVQPSLSNVITATLQYAARKKLRPEQRNEVEVFLLVRLSIHRFLVPESA